MTKVRNAVLVLMASAFGIAILNDGAPTTAAEEESSYYEQIYDLLTEQTVLDDPGVASAFIVDPPHAGAGLNFGDSVDKAVGLWGKPNFLNVSRGGKVNLAWDGGLALFFVDNRLQRIAVSRDLRFRTPGDLYMGADVTEIADAFGEPTSVDHMGLFAEYWRYKTSDGYFSVRLRQGQLDSIEFEAPGTGEP